MSSVFKRKGSDKYYFYYKDKFGKWRKKASLFTNRKSAEFEQQEFQRTISNQKYGYSEIKRILLNDFIKEYTEKISERKKSYKSDLSRIKNILGFFKNCLLYEIKTKDIDDFIQYRLNCTSARKKLVSKTTINREIELLKAMFNKAIEWEYLEKNPVNKIKKFREESRDKVLLNEEINALVRLAKEPLKSWIIIALNTGMRRGEILNLKWEDVNMKERFIYVKHTKTYENRKIPMNDFVWTMLNRIRMNIKPIGYVFFNPKTKKPFVEISSAWGTILKKAKIYDLTFHDLRGVFAANFLLKDHDLLSLQGVLGHKNIQTTMRYVQPHWKSIERSVNDLGKNFSNMNTDYSIAKFFHSTGDR